MPAFLSVFFLFNRRSTTIVCLLLILVLSLTMIPAYAQSDIPRLELQKKVFSLNEKEIWIVYEGAPTPLDIKLTNSAQKELYYLAVLRKVNETDHLVIILNSVPDAGRYHLSVKKDNYTLINTEVTWESEKMNIILPQRSMDSYVFPNEIQTVTLSFKAPQNGFYNVTESVPFNAIVLNTDAATIKKPELLGLSRPFNGDYELTLPYGVVDPEIHFGIPLHDGLDFALPSNTPVFAVDNGEVVPYREINQYGNTVAIQHGWGQSFYGHLSSMEVKIGDKIKRGELIGYSGNTGLSSGPHLHFGMKWESSFVDPLPFLSAITDTKSTSKQLSWRVQGKTNEVIKINYSYILPSDYYGEEDKPTFGPLRAITDNTPEMITESMQTTVRLGPTKEGDDDIRNQIKLSYNKVNHELSGMDLLTQTPFTQDLKTNEANYITLNNLRYEIHIDEKDEVTLKLTP